jgi:hypothetical protein
MFGCAQSLAARMAEDDIDELCRSLTPDEIEHIKLPIERRCKEAGLTQGDLLTRVGIRNEGRDQE